MQILLMRHGAAVGYGAVDRDEDRWLTAEGRAAVQRHARLLREAGLALDIVWTSPLVRAVQTAELLSDVLGCPNVRTHSAMAPDRGSVDEALAPVAAGGDSEVIALVGHEPKIRALSQRLGGSVAGAGFSTSEARLFDGSPDARRLLWTLDAQGLRRH